MEIKEKPSLVLRRRYRVTPERLWRAWTDPQAIRKWWGPGRNEAVSAAELDVRVGGRFRIVFGGLQGKAHEVQGLYKEVLAHRRLVFTWTWPNSTPERESLVTIALRELTRGEGGGTELHLRHEQLFDETVRDNHQSGWSEALDKLETFLNH